GKDMSLGTMSRNTLFGEIAVLCQGRRTTTVKAKERGVTFKISARLFLDLVRTSPEIGMQVMTVLAQRLERSTQLLTLHERRRVDRGASEHPPESPRAAH